MDEIIERLQDLKERLRQYLETKDLRELLDELSIDYRVAAGLLIVLALLLSISFFRRSDPSSTSEAVSSGAESESPSDAVEGTNLASLPNATISTATPGISGRPTRQSADSTSDAETNEENQSFVPILPAGEVPTRTRIPTPVPTRPKPPEPTPIPSLDFESIRERLQDQGQDLGFAKIGFHTGAGGNRTGLGEWMRHLDSAGVPFFLKSADDAGPIFDAQEIVRDSDVPHTLVYRRTGNEYDTPNYDLPPKEAARQHWQLHKDAFPDELDPELVWIETINEVDKERSEWLGYFATETARLALEDGYRWAAFGWSSGEPEITDWTTHSMLDFLRMAGEYPDQIAIALHEYSFLTRDIGHEYPFKLGRFQLLFEVADLYEIPRPTILITEWGWEYGDVPAGDQAMQDIHWAASMYAPYPEIKGAAIWYLGDGYRGIADKTQRLIEPVTSYSLGTYFEIPLPPDAAPIETERYSPR